MGGTACQVEAQSVQFPLCSKIDDSILGFSANSFHFPPRPVKTKDVYSSGRKRLFRFQFLLLSFFILKNFRPEQNLRNGREEEMRFSQPAMG